MAGADELPDKNLQKNLNSKHYWKNTAEERCGIFSGYIDGSAVYVWLKSDILLPPSNMVLLSEFHKYRRVKTENRGKTAQIVCLLFEICPLYGIDTGEDL